MPGRQPKFAVRSMASVQLKSLVSSLFVWLRCPRASFSSRVTHKGFGSRVSAASARLILARNQGHGHTGATRLRNACSSPREGRGHLH